MRYSLLYISRISPRGLIWICRADTDICPACGTPRSGTLPYFSASVFSKVYFNLAIKTHIAVIPPSPLIKMLRVGSVCNVILLHNYWPVVSYTYIKRYPNLAVQCKSASHTMQRHNEKSTSQRKSTSKHGKN